MPADVAHHLHGSHRDRAGLASAADSVMQLFSLIQGAVIFVIY